MRYIIKSGILSSEKNGEVYAKMNGTFWGAEKTIYLPNMEEIYHINIKCRKPVVNQINDVRFKTYTLTDTHGTVIMEARPNYANGDDPDMVGWPICRAPRVDHAEILSRGKPYMLIMHNNQNYSLISKSGDTILQIMHRGLSGGWTIDATARFSPEEICGIFTFCRYMEQENEFIVV
jgi:hypothetical protein